MIKRLILFIVIFAIFLTFITINLDNRYRCDINFGFTALNDVPVFLTVFISFFAGFFCALPLIFRTGKKNNTGKSKLPVVKEESPPSYSGGKYFAKKNKTKDSANDSQ
jgi:uncharacterized integral membrane protein